MRGQWKSAAWLASIVAITACSDTPTGPVGDPQFLLGPVLGPLGFLDYGDDGMANMKTSTGTPTCFGQPATIDRSRTDPGYAG